MSKSRKKLYVVAYDITSTRRRKRVALLLGKYGSRVNFSVFECMFLPGQLLHVKEKIEKIIDGKSDSVIYYPLCIDCYVKVSSQGRSYEPKSSIIKTI